MRTLKTEINENAYNLRLGTTLRFNLGSKTDLDDKFDREERLEDFVPKRAFSDYLNGIIPFKEYLYAKNFPKKYAKKKQWANSPNRQGDWDKRVSMIKGQKMKVKMTMLKNVVHDKIHKKKTVKETILKNSDLYSVSNDQTQFFKNYAQICNDYSLKIKNKDLLGDNPSQKYYDRKPKKSCRLSQMTLISEKDRRCLTERKEEKFLDPEVFKELSKDLKRNSRKLILAKSSPRTRTNEKHNFNETPNKIEREISRKFSVCKDYLLSNRKIDNYQIFLMEQAKQKEKELKKMGFDGIPEVKKNMFSKIAHNWTQEESDEYSDDSDMPSVTEHVLDDYYSKSKSLQKAVQENPETNTMKKLQQILKLHEIQSSISKISNNKITLKGKFFT